MCEAIKLYLDAPGIIFILACDVGVLARGVSGVTGGQGRTEDSVGSRYLEKIVQVHHRLPGYGDSAIRRLISHFAAASGTEHLMDETLIDILATRGDRNPRRIKRIINSFVMEQQLNSAWRRPPLSSAQLLTVVILRHLYPSFFAYLTQGSPDDDPVGYFLDYADVKARAQQPPPTNSAWWSIVERISRRRGLATPSRDETTAADLQSHLEALERILPPEFPELASDSSFIALLSSLGTTESRVAVRAELLRHVDAEASHDVTEELGAPLARLEGVQ
ncbi:P-loop NTPase fold protein [Ornithinimicrobium sp. Y1694]|uniref:P-loop NTPase fold protein n=1 Tax=Ornithinimicrobium sp. Y1694 TaxID=3418590 RepID=UPI003CF8C337